VWSPSASQLPPAPGSQTQGSAQGAAEGGAGGGARDAGGVQGCLWSAFCGSEGDLLPPGDAGLQPGSAGVLPALCPAGTPEPPAVLVSSEGPEHQATEAAAAQQVLEQMRRADFVLAALAEETVAGGSTGAATGEGPTQSREGATGSGPGYVVYERASQRVPLLGVHADFFLALHACARLIGVHERALLRGLFLLEDSLLPQPHSES